MYDPKEILTGRKILIVDDDTQIISNIGQNLRRKGIDVLQATNVTVAFNIYQNNRKPGQSPIDAILSDYDMPGGNGNELFNKIKTGFPDDYDLLVKIGWSGIDASRFYGKYDLGDIITLQKPLTPSILRNTLAQNLAYKDRLRELIKSQS